MSGPELLTQLKVRDTFAEAERIHRVSAALRERKAARPALIRLSLPRFWKGYAGNRPALQPPSS